MLLIDNNPEFSLQTLSKNMDTKPLLTNKLINFDTELEDQLRVSAKFYLNTLNAYENYGEAAFTMTDVKRMTSTEDFLKMPLKDRKCDIELFEDCKTRKLLENAIAFLGRCQNCRWAI